MTEDAQRKARDRIERALRVTGWKPARLAREAGLAVSTLTRFLYRDPGYALSLTTIEKIDKAVERYIEGVRDARESIRLTLLYAGAAADALTAAMVSIKVRGAVRAGHWAEAMEWPAEDWLAVTLPRPGPYRSCFGLRVDGPSMNEIYPDGSILVCVPIVEYGEPLADEDHVIVQRWHDGMVEATVKELRYGEDGRIWLWPRSTHPEHQTPIELPSNGLDHPDYEGNEEIRVIAVVVADYRVRRPPRQA